ncbi:MAG: hypothetical protein Q9162_004902 [Coniocarpon cinnabarinum]
MSGWGAWFGGGGQRSSDTPKNAILQLRSTMDMLSKREKHLKNQMDEQDSIARRNVNANKALAKAALRRKKNFEHTLEQTSAQMMTVEREIASIETANINKETFVAMTNASKAMKQIHGNLNIDRVDATMEDLREQHAIGEEIAQTLTTGAQADALDEDDLNEELESMQQEQLDERMVGAGKVPVGDKIDRERLPSMPSAPVSATKSRQEQEEDLDEEEELKKLQAEMAM